MLIANKKYRKIVCILYNGTDVNALKLESKSNKKEVVRSEVGNLAPALQSKKYYLALFKEDKIDKQKNILSNKKINDCLHVQFGIKNLYHRMIITACALVAKRYGALLVKATSFPPQHLADSQP